MTALDHVVVNTLRGMAAAADTFTALGFAPTPLGRHSLGSINHLMMTPTAYLELVGVPDEGRQRQEVLDSPFGLNGLVLATRDADATFARLQRDGFAPLPPAAFSRPVAIGDRVEEARFRTVRLPAQTTPAGRVYFCEHRTPDLLWRPEWLSHPNGFAAIDRLRIAGREPERDVAVYAAICDAPVGPGSVIALDAFRIEFVAGPARFVELGLRFDGLDELERRATALTDVAWTRHDATTASLLIGALDLHLDCWTIA